MELLKSAWVRTDTIKSGQVYGFHSVLDSPPHSWNSEFSGTCTHTYTHTHTHSCRQTVIQEVLLLGIWESFTGGSQRVITCTRWIRGVYEAEGS